MLKVGAAAALLLIGGIVGSLVMRGSGGAPDGAKQSSAEPVAASTSPSPSPVSTPSAPANGAPRAVAATPASSRAAGAAPAWHSSLQPAVVAATRADSLAPYQVQVERWGCEGERCVSDLRIPPTVAASRDMSSAADVFNSLKKQMAEQDIGVSMKSMRPGPLGLAISLEFTQNASRQGRFYTFAEIADIRGDSFQQGHKAAEQELAAHATH